MIILYPLELLLKFFLDAFYCAFNSYGIAIILLSLVVTIILIPFYHYAEILQAREKAVQRAMKPKMDEYKSVYKGYELYLYMKNLYRQHNYSPIYSLRSLVGLAIQLPFFIAAYHFIGYYTPIAGNSFWIFSDLGVADGLLSIAGMHINVLPFVMTFISLVSGYVYADDLTDKNQIVSLFFVPFLFLVLLYTAPSSLLLYWTMNNVWSLIKNIIYKRFNLINIG